MEKKGVEINETEQQLKKLYDEAEIRDFSAVWEDIKDKIDEPVIVEKKKRNFWAYFSATTAFILVCICGVFLFNFLKNRANDTVYFNDRLTTELATEDVFFSSISKKVVDMTEYVGTGFTVYKTNKGIVKGGKLQFANAETAPTITVSLEFYDDDVKMTENTEVEYEKTATVNGAAIKYNTEQLPDMPIYIYTIEANYNSVNYYMTCTCTLTDPTPFFTEFFS